MSSHGSGYHDYGILDVLCNSLDVYHNATFLLNYTVSSSFSFLFFFHTSVQHPVVFVIEVTINTVYTTLYIIFYW
jgi:hypothetical protein